MKTRNQLKSSKKITLNLNLTLHQKKLFEQAAYLCGHKSLASFAMQVIQKIANGVLKEDKSILASENDRSIFFKAMENPPKPNKALKKAIADYKNSLK